MRLSQYTRGKAMKQRNSADRSRRFCWALAAESEDRKAMPWWSSVDAIARRLGMAYDETFELARTCAEAGYVTRDRSHFTKPGRRGAVQLHIVTLKQAGRELVMGTG